MIIEKYISTKIAPCNHAYWEARGYPVTPPQTRSHNYVAQVIEVLVTDLPPKSNKKVLCLCDECGDKFIAKFSNKTDMCYHCRKSIQMMGNTFGEANKGKPGLSGEDHPNWNPNKSELATYSSRVHWLTSKVYEEHKEEINPENHPRTLSGVEGGRQLDHIVSIKEGFEQGIDPELIACKENLQILTWQDNRSKW